ncbi:MAG: type II toxin-antitoxin system VapC family toxin [Moraxellaceae bacterium]|nr:type II toxin-antitoxin system VapC family toxin [Moraxellaceae bacterium]
MAHSNHGYLLDTHTLIWLIDNPEKLSPKVANILLNENNSLYYSMISIWEITIKISIGKLDLQENWYEVFQTELFHNRILPISMNWQQMQILEKLPFYHRDPFDRMLIAQAQFNKLQLLSKDSVFSQYDISVIW